MTQIRNAAGVTACALALVGCGGGGGGSAGVEVPTGVRSVNASAGSDVSAAGFAGFAAPLARAVLGVTGNGIVGAVVGSPESPQSAQRPSSAVATVMPARWVRAGIGHASARFGAAAREQAQAVFSETLPCDFGGTLTVTIDDADNNDKLSAGDGLTLAANACVLEPGLPAANGSVDMRVNAVELDSDEAPTALDVSASFGNFSLAGLGSMNGQFRLWQKAEATGGERLRVSYQGLTVVEPAQTLTYDFDIHGLVTASGGSFDLNGGLGIGGQTYALVGADVFTYSGVNPPASGSLHLRDAAGDAVRLVARSATTVDFEFYPAGATAPSATLLGQTWSSYRQ